MGCHNYEDLLRHKGHKIVCVSYGDDDNIAIECESCNEVLMDFDKPSDEIVLRGSQDEHKVSKEEIDSIKKEIEDKIYIDGMFHKRGGNWDVIATLDEDGTQEAYEEREYGEPIKYVFIIELVNNEEDYQEKETFKVAVYDLDVRTLESE